MKIKGLVAAPFTPMTAEGSINLAAIPSQAELLRRNGVAGVFVCGTTGESMSLTLDERMRVAKTWAENCDQSLRLIVHVGHDCLTNAKILAEHSQEIGAAAIGALAPVFFKPANMEMLVEVCRQIAGAASKTPFYYYHIPSMTGIDLAMERFLQMAEPVIPNLAGIKFTFENLYDFGQCVDYQNNRFDLLFGRDEIMTSGLVVGARGFIGSFYNFMAPLFNEIINAFNAGELERSQALQRKVREFTAVFYNHGSNVATAKAIMALTGLDCGPVRPPLAGLSADQARNLHKDLKKIGYFEYCSR